MPGVGVRLELAAVCCSLQGLFITPEEMFELRCGLEAGLAALQLGGNVSLLPWLCCLPVPACPRSRLPPSPPRVGLAGCLEGWFDAAEEQGWGRLVLSALPSSNPPGRALLLWGDGGSEGDPAGTAVPRGLWPWDTGVLQDGAGSRV